jgi:hypothetical protein
MALMRWRASLKAGEIGAFPLYETAKLADRS